MLIMPNESKEKTQFRVRMGEDTFKEIENYCHWAGIKTKDYFIERACQFIFSNDKDWKNFKNTLNEADS